jgi:RNA polymerase sigma factor (sigma-70 family)
MKNHGTLLGDYAANGSESAFRELVECYFDLVYSTAVRLVNGDVHRAEDVVQMVFTDLARQAGTLSHDVMLGGWLHRRTFHVATTLQRNERRRQQRERQATEMNVPQNDPAAGFDQIAPFLDEAINELNARDRAAIVLRFFERRDLRAIGAALGSNEDAAQKCVSRAVEKLRAHFIRRGVVVSASLIASALATGTVQSAPVGLASAVTTASLAGAASKGSIGLVATLAKTLLMKKNITVIAIAVVTVAVISFFTVAEVIRARADAPATAKDIQQGLVLHYTFDQDETGGSQITDTSGKGNSGRASGVRWTPDGKNGGAYEFAADGDEIVVTNNGSLNPEKFTLSVWVQTTTADHFWRRIFDKSYSRGYALSVAGDWRQNNWNGRICLEVGPGDHSVLSRIRVSDGRWHHVAATFDGTDQLVYVDGQLQGKWHWDHPGKAGSNDFNLVIGCNRSNLSNEYGDLGTSFRGLIDEPMMWNRALSEKEIAFLYQSQSGTAASQTAAR